jgi:hypothetical protein
MNKGLFGLAAWINSTGGNDMEEKAQETTPDPLPNSGKANQGKGGENDKGHRRRAYREAVEKRAAAERTALGKDGGKADRNDSGAGGDPNRAAKAEDESSPYFLDPDGYLCRMKRYRDVEIKIRLANFSAHITEENIVDDGAERAIFYTIQGNIRGNQSLPTIEIAAAQFQGMSWPHKLGSRAILEPGRSVADNVRHAIQISSPDAPVKTHFAHTGWRQVNGSWAYLHADGAVGAENVSVRLAPEYKRFSLPATPENEADAIKTSMSFLEIGKREITLPLMAYLYLSPLTTILPIMPNFSLYLFGVSGSFKTTLAALSLSHFGNFASIDSLPNFNDTAGSIEKRAFRLKDTLFLLDDYAPSHRKQDRERKEEVCQAAIRSFANRTGRARLKSDASEMVRTYPRGLLLVTGEESPSLQSTIARTLLIEISRKDIDRECLTALQNKAHRFPHAMTSYILWIKENMGAITGAFPERFRALRSQATNDGNHGRLAEQTAFLMFGLETLVNWLSDKKIFTESEARERITEGWSIFQSLSVSQNRRIAGDDPITGFFEILGTLVYQHRARLDPSHHEGEPLGAADRIGFYDSTRLYLQFNAAWNSAMTFLSKEGGHFPFSKTTLLYMLKQRGSIVLARNGDATKPKTIGGESFRVVEIQDRVLISSVTSVISGEE